MDPVLEVELEAVKQDQQGSTRSAWEERMEEG